MLIHRFEKIVKYQLIIRIKAHSIGFYTFLLTLIFYRINACVYFMDKYTVYEYNSTG